MPRVKRVFSVLSLGWASMKGDLRTHFSKYGNVVRIGIPMNTQTGFNKGVGIVEVVGENGFEEKVLSDYHTIDQKEVRVMLRIQRTETNRRTKSTAPSEDS